MSSKFCLSWDLQLHGNRQLSVTQIQVHISKGYNALSLGCTGIVPALLLHLWRFGVRTVSLWRKSNFQEQRVEGMQTQTKLVLNSATASIKGGLLLHQYLQPHAKAVTMCPRLFLMKVEVASCLKRCIWKRDYLFLKATSMKSHHCNLTGGKSAQQPLISCTFHLWVKSCPGDVQSSHWLHNGKCITYLELTWLYLEWFNT